MPVRAPKTLFVTGASAGLGLAMARKALSEGCEVWGMRRNAGAIPAPIHALGGDACDPAAHAGLPPRAVPERPVAVRLAGLEQFEFVR